MSPRAAVSYETTGDPADASRKPFWAKCLDCAHCWPAAYLPMEARACAKLVARSACPNCGAIKNIAVAKQKGGVLQEPAA